MSAWRERALDYLSVTWSHPRWLVRRWLDRLGLDVAEAWVRFNSGPAPLTLRVNTIRTSPEALRRRLTDHGVSVQPTTYAPAGLLVTDGNPIRTPLWDEGLFAVQDEASQLIPLAAIPDGGARLLDTCAAPGGKTTEWAGLAPDAHIVAAEVRPRRLELLRQTVQRSGAGNIRLVAADLAVGLPFGPEFEVVAVDAPCSGLGTLRRDPDIKWRRREEDLGRLAEQQVIMLRHAAGAVRPGGHLIYSTCSSEPEENEEVIDRFLSMVPWFVRRPLPWPGSRLPPAVVNKDGALETAPDRHGLEAFFAVVLQRRVGGEAPDRNGGPRR